MNRRSRVAAVRRSSWQQPASGALPSRRYAKDVHGHLSLVPESLLRILKNTSSSNRGRPLQSSETDFITLLAGFIPQKRGFISNRRRRGAA